MTRQAFTKDNTQMIKGVAIIIMIVHHCFLSPDRYKQYEVIFSPLSQDAVTKIAAFFKICVGMYAFLSAYGMTVSLMKQSKRQIPNKTSRPSYTFNRWFSLMASWWFIFVVCEIFCLIKSRQPLLVYGTGVKGLYNFGMEALGLAHLMGTPTLIGTWWYMSLAVLIVLLVPLMVMLYDKIGLLLLPLTFFVPRALQLGQTDFVRWSLVLALGIVCAKQDWLARLKEMQYHKNPYISKLLKWIVLSGILVLCVFVRESKTFSKLYELKDGLIPAFVVYYCYELLTDIKGLNRLLHFLGKHSLNIFLFHTFIRYTYYGDFIYGMRYAPLIALTLLAVSVAVSVVLELIKKLIRYDKGVAFLRRKLNLLFFEKKQAEV